MPEFVPNGYVSIHEALDLLGRQLFPSEWNGRRAQRRVGDLISEHEWLAIKDLAPARGGGARAVKQYREV
jgi:hypothetical protein